MPPPMKDVVGLCIHHTAGPQGQTLESIRADQMKRGYSDCAYHFVLQLDNNGRGHLKRGRPDTMQGCHGVRYYNDHYLGLVVPGNYSKITMSEELYQDLLAGVKHVLKLYKIGPDKVIGHREIKATACPGDHFPLARLKADVKQS